MSELKVVAAVFKDKDSIRFAHRKSLEKSYNWQELVTISDANAAITEAYEKGKRDAVPDGWIVVPKEPTQAMLNAAGIAVWNATYWCAAYKAMIAAAPKEKRE